MWGSDRLVNDFLRYKLQRRGVAWELPPRRRSDASLPWRPDAVRAWHRGGEGEEPPPGEEELCVVMATAAPAYDVISPI